MLDPKSSSDRGPVRLQVPQVLDKFIKQLLSNHMINSYGKQSRCQVSRQSESRSENLYPSRVNLFKINVIRAT